MTDEVTDKETTKATKATKESRIEYKTDRIERMLELRAIVAVCCSRE